MSGHPRVIGYLQRALDHEFGVARQFTLQAGQADVLGLPALAVELRTAASEELAHAGAFIARLYALGTTPRAGNAGTPGVGRTHRKLLLHGVATEASAIRLYTEAARFCQQIRRPRQRRSVRAHLEQRGAALPGVGTVNRVARRLNVDEARAKLVHGGKQCPMT